MLGVRQPCRGRHVSDEQLPSLAAEDYACEACALLYTDITIEQAVGVMSGLPAAIGEAVSAIPRDAPTTAQPAGLVGDRVCLPSARRVHRVHHPAAPRPHREPTGIEPHCRSATLRVRPPVSLRGTSIGLDVHALSVVAHAVDEVTGEVSRARLCPDHGEIFCGLSLVRAPVRVVYEEGSPGGCSGGAGSCDPMQISVHVGALGAGCSPDGVGG
jgi:hypothetical protein